MDTSILCGFMDWLSFYKEFYFHEIERKFSLMRSMSVPIGIATVLASGLLLMAGRLSHIDSIFDIALLVLLCCAGMLLFVSFYFMKCAYFNHAYHYVPTTLQIDSHRRDLENYYELNMEKTQALKLANDETITYLIKLFAETAHHNSMVNDTRTRFMFWANAALSAALLLLILGAVATLVDTTLISI